MAGRKQEVGEEDEYWLSKKSRCPVTIPGRGST